MRVLPPLKDRERPLAGHELFRREGPAVPPVATSDQRLASHRGFDGLGRGVRRHGEGHRGVHPRNSSRGR